MESQTKRLFSVDTPIFCISPLYTARPVSEKTGIHISEHRQTVESIIKDRQVKGDSRIFLIKGDTITSQANLRGEEAPQDPVHLGIEGAALFSEQLFKIIRSHFQS